MKSWKILIRFDQQVMEVVINASYYSAASNAVQVEYPGCKILSITESRVY